MTCTVSILGIRKFQILLLCQDICILNAKGSGSKFSHYRMSNSSSAVTTDDEGYNSRQTAVDETDMNDAGTTSFSASSSDTSSVAGPSQIDEMSFQSEPGSGCCMLDWRSEMTPGRVS